MGTPFNPGDIGMNDPNALFGSNVFGGAKTKTATPYMPDSFGGGISDKDIYDAVYADPNSASTKTYLKNWLPQSGKTTDDLASALNLHSPEGTHWTGQNVADWLGLDYGGGSDIGVDFGGLPFSTSYNYGGGSNESGLLDDETRDDVKDTLDQVKEWLPFYEQSMQTLMDLPAQIDEWSNDISRRYRVSGDDITRTMTEAGNRRAAKGIVGGTESENITSNLLSGLREGTQQQQTDALNNAITQKIGAIAASPAMAALPMDFVTNLFNQLQQSIGSSGSGGGSTDTSGAWNTLSNMIMGGYVG